MCWSIWSCSGVWDSSITGNVINTRMCERIAARK